MQRLETSPRSQQPKSICHEYPLQDGIPDQPEGSDQPRRLSHKDRPQGCLPDVTTAHVRMHEGTAAIILLKMMTLTFENLFYLTCRRGECGFDDLKGIFSDKFGEYPLTHFLLNQDRTLNKLMVIILGQE